MKIFEKQHLILAIVVVVGFGILAFGGGYIWKENLLKNRYRLKTSALEKTIQIYEKKLFLLDKEKMGLTEELGQEKSRNQMFENQINDIFGTVGNLSGTVGTLKKLSETDKELLQKYSKTYFLNEHYVPVSLLIINAQYIYDKNKPQQFHVDGLAFLERMLQAAEVEDISLKVVSAYRSFNTQTTLKSNYKVVYGSGANQFSADQGYSEHQLGTAIDFTSSEIKDVFLGFEKTKSYQWLTQNAYKYGFVLSYPSDNAYYQFEPWHWRFVGVALASQLKNENKYFYELTQREIDGYLVNIFD